jgi:hypothetical protein
MVLPLGFRLSPQRVGIIPESVMERYMAAKQVTGQKFASTIKGTENAPARNVERANRHLIVKMSTG